MVSMHRGEPQGLEATWPEGTRERVTRGGSSRRRQTSWLGPKRPSARRGTVRVEPLLDELADHRHEGRVRPGRRRAREPDPASAAASRASTSRSNSTSMWSETKPIGDTTTSCTPRSGKRADVVADVGLEPRHPRRPAAALVDDRVVGAPTALRDEPRRLGELALVARLRGHRRRDRVRREDEVRAARRSSGTARAPPRRAPRSPRRSRGGCRTCAVAQHLGRVRARPRPARRRCSRGTGGSSSRS